MVADGVRLDVQGLRAIAVLVVVLYHARVPGFAGGFVGVDVFFVISGFVIGSSMLREIDRTGRVSLVGFYSRRVRRIVPALFVTIAVTAVVSALVIDLGRVQTQIMRSGLAATFAVSNFFFMSHGDDYFAVDERLNPFLHTWSLAVEEQFYLVAPILIAGLVLLAARTRWSVRIVVAAVVGVLAAVSAALSIVWVGDGSADQAFFHPLSRFWEIAVGIVLAAAPPTLARSIRPALQLALAVASLAILTVVVLTYDDTTAFPGLRAAPPVLATLLLIISAPSCRPLERALSARHAVWIGDRSYGWYLWHWPLIVFAGVLISDSPVVLLAASALGLAAAGVSYRVIEQPIRSNHEMRGRRLAKPAVAAFTGMSVLLGAGVAGAEQRWGIYDPRLHGISWGEAGCFSRESWNVDRCTFPPDRKSAGTLMVVGDSHAGVFTDGLIVAANELGYTLVAVTGCPMIQVEAEADACPRYRAAAWDAFERVQPDVVVMAHRSTLFGTPGQVGDPAERAVVWRDGLASIRARLAAEGAALVTIDVVPEYDFSEDEVTISVVDRSLETHSISRADLEARRGPVTAIEHEVVGAGMTIDPAETLCTDTACSTTGRDGSWWYLDDNHINRAASLALAPQFERDLTRILAGIG